MTTQTSHAIYTVIKIINNQKMVYLEKKLGLGYMKLTLHFIRDLNQQIWFLPGSWNIRRYSCIQGSDKLQANAKVNSTNSATVSLNLYKHQLSLQPTVNKQWCSLPFVVSFSL